MNHLRPILYRVTINRKPIAFKDKFFIGETVTYKPYTYGTILHKENHKPKGDNSFWGKLLTIYHTRPNLDRINHELFRIARAE